MFDEFLLPVDLYLQQSAHELDQFCIGGKIKFEFEESELNNKASKIVIVGLKEYRYLADENQQTFDEIRKALYQLKIGNWHLPIYDLGDILQGNSQEDTGFAIESVLSSLLRKNCIVVTIGGNSGMIYYHYRAFDHVQPLTNYTAIDNQFRIGIDTEKLNYSNHLSKIISEPPFQLFEYAHLGYQTYFVNQEELDIMEELNFETLRLGQLIPKTKESEPILRDTDLLHLNLDSIETSGFKSNLQQTPNGFSNREICALSRYAGISPKIKSFYISHFINNNIASDAVLVAEIIWYFIEGKNRDLPSRDYDDYQSFEKIHVPIDEQIIVFYHDIQHEQWWIEINNLVETEEKGKHIIPCSKKDYRQAISGEIPYKWWKSYKKFY